MNEMNNQNKPEFTPRQNHYYMPRYIPERRGETGAPNVKKSKSRVGLIIFVTILSIIIFIELIALPQVFLMYGNEEESDAALQSTSVQSTTVYREHNKNHNDLNEFSFTNFKGIV